MNRWVCYIAILAASLLLMPAATAQSADARDTAEAVVDDMRFMKRLFSIAGINSLSDGELAWYEGTLANIIDEDNQHANLCGLHAMVATQEAGIAVAAPAAWAEEGQDYESGSLRDWLFTHARNGIVNASQSDDAYARLLGDLTHQCRSKRFIAVLNPELRMGSLAMLEQDLCYRERLCPPDPDDN